MTNNIEALLAQAQGMAAQVASAPPVQSAALPALAQTATTPAVALGGGTQITLDDIGQGSLAVDGWLKLTEYGLSVGDDAKFNASIKVSVCADEIAPHKALRVTIGDKTTYYRTTDGIREARSGKPWDQLVAECKASDPKCSGDYYSADVPFTLLEDLMDAKGNLLLSAGQQIGTTIPMTGMKFFREFKRKVLDRYARSTVLNGTIVHVKMENGKNKWGVIGYGDPTMWAPAEVAQAA